MNENPSKSSAVGGGSRPEITTRLSPAPAAREFTPVFEYSINYSTEYDEAVEAPSPSPNDSFQTRHSAAFRSVRLLAGQITAPLTEIHV